MSNQPMAIVTPWWSERAVGGAEFLAREVATRFLERGRPVDILTTCGENAFSDWSEDRHEPGCVNENGLTVRRFPLDPREQDRFARIHLALMHGVFLPPSEQLQFFADSINSRALYSFIEQHREKYVFCFLPYPYGTTYHGMRAAAERAILIPCLHDEPVAYMRTVRAMMESARGIWFLSEPEYRFANSLYKLQQIETRIVGAGMDFCGRGDGAAFRRARGIEGPYVMFAGRRVPGKGYDRLLKVFARFGARHPEWSLVLAGLGGEDRNDALPRQAVDIGCVDKQALWDAMAGATAFCQPSRYESFSYVLMEAWVQQTPALVNARCEVLRWQCETAGGGLWFNEDEEFERALLYLQSHPQEAADMGRSGADYVKSELKWCDVIDRAEGLLAACGLA